ncbi:MAG: hypothetical protein H8E31_06250 [Planctomycetes bacterium]|nr:hypothetical protein [Planctomycetota bacterium]
MNLFALEGDSRRDLVDWRASARSVDDLRVSKMAVEACQMLCTVARGHGFSAPYRATHARHPCTLWVASSSGNFRAAMDHARALLEEWAARFGHRPEEHRSFAVLEWCARAFEKEGLESCFPSSTETAPALAVPQEFQAGGVIRSYRRFWVSKTRMRYREERLPAWFRQARTTPFELRISPGSAASSPSDADRSRSGRAGS